MRKLPLFVMSFFYLIAGANHFLNPDFYLGLIPSYLPFPVFINYMVAIVEIILAVLLLFPNTRKFSSLGIVILLVFLVPSHVYFIQMGSCVPDGLCTSKWISWSRLLLGQPLLIWWAWSLKNL